MKKKAVLILIEVWLITFQSLAESRGSYVKRTDTALTDHHADTLHADSLHADSLHAVFLHAVFLHADPLPADSLHAVFLHADSLHADPPRKLSLLRRIIRGFDRLDTRYIEPQHYLFTVMLQSTYTYDYYTLRSRGEENHSVSFAPDGSFKVGPYFGWKWFFGGYTFTLGHSSFNKTKTEIDLSLYSSQIGLDLFYRRTGSDYKLRNVNLGKEINTTALEDVPFDGVKAGITGFNLYYIFNHGRFSYPAAFAQSTQQKISCGSWLAGIGYTQNTLDFDYDELEEIVEEKLGSQVTALDSSLMFNSAKYYDFSISCGYAYNWVIARNWLLCVSGQVALAYKQSKGESYERELKDNQSLKVLRDFSLTKINPSAVGRLGVVYNAMRWYAGFSAIIRSNYYLESQFSTNNTFGSMNIYVGYNFGLKKKYRKK